MILRNSGKLGFNFSIIDPQKSDKSEDETEGQRKVLEEAKLQLDTQQQKGFKQDERGQEVRPGCPVIIPNMVSSPWDYFRCGRVFYYKDTRIQGSLFYLFIMTRLHFFSHQFSCVFVFLVCVCVCVSG